MALFFLSSRYRVFCESVQHIVLYMNLRVDQTNKFKYDKNIQEKRNLLMVIANLKNDNFVKT